MSNELYTFTISMMTFFLSFIGLESGALIYNVISVCISFFIFFGAVALNWITYNSIIFYFALITSLINFMLLPLNKNNRKRY